MQKGFAKIFSSLFCLMAIIAFSTVAHAQFRAGLQGTVADPNGGVVPGASVTLTNNETGRSQQTTTGEGGFYRFSGLVGRVENLPGLVVSNECQAGGAVTATPDRLDPNLKRIKEFYDDKGSIRPAHQQAGKTTTWMFRFHLR